MAEEASEHLTPSNLPDNSWGIPDWRDPSAYPDPETTSIAQWKWEFLRRSPDYRHDWLKHFISPFLEFKKEHPVQPHETHEENGKEPFLSPEAGAYFDRLLQRVEMPGSTEKYGLEWLPNPQNASPECLPFTDLPEEMVVYGIDENVRNWSGLHYTLFPGEVLLQFDLTLQPVERLFALYTKRVLKGEDEDGVCEGIDRDVVSSWDLMLHGKDMTAHSPLPKSKLDRGPRILLDPRKKALAHVIFDKSQKSFGKQWAVAKEKLEALQKTLVGDLPQRRFHPDVGQNYLRILDARSPDPVTKKPLATYAEIGREVLKIKKDPNKARARAKQDHDQAQRLLTHFPY